MSSRQRRLRTTLTAVLTATLAIAGCAGSDPGGGAETSDPPGSYPITIGSALGEAVIESAPERVVTIGHGAADIAFALGVVPVGVEADAWGGDGDGYHPWFREAVEQAGEELPATFAAYPELDLDAVVDLAPDLILAPQSGITQADFDLLNELAPTVAYPGQPWSTPWDTSIELIGTALDRPDEAAGLIEEIDGQLAEAAAAHPEFAETTFAYIYTGEPGTLGVFQAEEPRATFLTKLGLRIPPEVAELPVTEGTASSMIGLENADLLDTADVVVTWFTDPEEQAQIESQALFAQIPAVERGSYVVSHDRQFVTAHSLLTPLTVPWVLDDYTGYLQDAVDHLD